MQYAFICYFIDFFSWNEAYLCYLEFFLLCRESVILSIPLVMRFIEVVPYQMFEVDGKKNKVYGQNLRFAACDFSLLLKVENPWRLNYDINISTAENMGRLNYDINISTARQC
ncbi:uncharacterized protein LOC116009711 [Ipomoea triloba]|uniref:uncharacterized protein LOC116009711 n=1 Tax=Ipomoea triloba TaxID=35885 RepID=UPI00125DB784|nr:uncharacterized protein LOC116009711 [Ipomoea triloba]